MCLFTLMKECVSIYSICLSGGRSVGQFVCTDNTSSETTKPTWTKLDIEGKIFRAGENKARSTLISVIEGVKKGIIFIKSFVCRGVRRPLEGVMGRVDARLLPSAAKNGQGPENAFIGQNLCNNSCSPGCQD